MTGFASPEDAAIAEDTVPAEFVKIVAVDYAPDKGHAIVLIEYNEPPDVEPYAVLCQNTPGGWVAHQSGSADGVSWMSTSERLGVEVTWGDPPLIRWGVPSDEPPAPESPPGANTW